MNKRNCLIISVMVFFLFACRNPSGTDSNSIGSLRSVKTKGIKSLYSSSYSINGNQSKVLFNEDISRISTLSYITNDGKNKPIIFKDSYGQDIILKTSNIRYIEGPWIITEFSALYTGYENNYGDFVSTNQTARYGKILANMQTGILYDFTSYAIDNILYNNGIIYTTDSYWNSPYSNATLYRVVLGANMQAVPLNNYAYDRAGKINILVGEKIISGFEKFNGSNTYQYYGKSFDTNGLLQPKIVNVPDGVGSISGFNYLEFPYNYIVSYLDSSFIYPNRFVIDNNDDSWYYIT